MADTSAVARVIIAKYDDVMPLHRQEHVSDREGFALPRSTQCGWLSAAYGMLHRIVTAMFDEARAKAFCIATDATGARVRGKGCCDSWHVFVFIADRDHVVFRFVPEHTSPAVAALLRGFRGYLLSDAAPVYDVLHRSGDVIEVACWFHARRYFWRALETNRGSSMEALAIIRELFHVDRECRDIAMPVRTGCAPSAPARCSRCSTGGSRPTADVPIPAGRSTPPSATTTTSARRCIASSMTGASASTTTSPREPSETWCSGRHNWQRFANKTGLAWYTTFRSLIARRRHRRCESRALRPRGSAGAPVPHRARS